MADEANPKRSVVSDMPTKWHAFNARLALLVPGET
jgi:hypothetical protein